VPITRRIARPLIAGMFISGGIDALLHPDAKAPRAQAVTEPITDTLGIDQDPVTLVRVNGAVMVVGGVLLGTGRVPRLAALALAGSLIPTTLAGHRFWEIDDPTQRQQQRIHFLKNLSMLGGLILAATDTEGRPSLSWRAKKRARRTLDALPTGD
jgi:putative oxidoreductase